MNKVVMALAMLVMAWGGSVYQSSIFTYPDLATATAEVGDLPSGAVVQVANGGLYHVAGGALVATASGEVPEVYDDSVITARVAELESAPDADTVYDDSILTGRVETLENAPVVAGYDDAAITGRVEALENTPDNDTIYDDSAVIGRLDAVEAEADGLLRLSTDGTGSQTIAGDSLVIDAPWGFNVGGGFIGRVDFGGGVFKITNTQEVIDLALNSVLNAEEGDARYVRIGEGLTGPANTIAVVIPADGQSNQVGFGEVFDRGVDEQPLTNLFQLSGGDSRFYDAGAAGDIIPARLPLSLEVANTNVTESSVSIPWYVARNYARENPEVDVYVVSTAVGSTGFFFGGWNVGDPLYENSIARVNSTLALLDGMYDNVSIPFWLWHQGESDGVEARRSALDNGLTVSIQDRRDRVPRFAGAPFIMGEISEIHEDHEAVNAILRGVADGSDLIGLADSAGLDSNGVNIHFTGAELRIFASRYISVIDSYDDPFPVVDDTSPLDVLTSTELGSGVWNAGSEVIFGLSVPDINTGLIARYEFDDLSDSTGNQVDATSGVAPVVANGLASFDGGNFLETGIQQSGSFTRAVRFRSNGTGQNNHNLVSSQNFPMLINFTANNGALIFGSVSAPRVLDDRQNYSDNEWHTLVVAYDHATGRSIMFVDGFLVRSSRNAIANENSLLFLGSFTASVSTNNLIGDMDWVRVYDRALSDREAQFLSQLAVE